MNKFKNFLQSTIVVCISVAIILMATFILAKAQSTPTTGVGELFFPLILQNGIGSDIDDPMVDDNTAAIHHILVTGQSLAKGSGGNPAVAPILPNAGHGQYWNGNQFEAKKQPNPDTTFPSVSLVHTLANHGSKRWAINTEGFGGATYDQLRKGSDVYRDQIANVKAAYEYATARNIPYSVDALVVIHGAAEVNNANYAQNLLDWQNDYAVDVEEIVGSWAQIPLFTNQMSNPSNVAIVHLEQLDAHLNNGDLFLVGPMYQYTHIDGLHLNGPGYYHVGEVMSRVMDKVLNQGEQWEPLRPIKVSTSGNIIDIQYVVPAGSIQFDTQTVPKQTNYGFNLIDTSASIENVSIINSNTVRLKLSNAPSSDAKVEYYSGNLRDGETATSELDGTALPNWGVVFQLSAFQGVYYPPNIQGTPTPTPPSENDVTYQTVLAAEMVTESGAINANQPVENLHKADQFGTDDDWFRFVKFATGSTPYQGYRSYFVPRDMAHASITSLQVNANYRGPATERQIWTWRLFNWSTQSWTTIGDNSGAPWWGDWTMLSFDATAERTNFVNASTGEIRVQVQANSTIDTMDLDYEAVIIGMDGNVPTESTVVYAEDTTDFNNPERGFYDTVDIALTTDLDWVRNRGLMLAHSYIRLDDYRTQPIPQELLDKIERGLSAARASGIKIILRASYNFPGADYPNAVDAPVDWVLFHIEQLKPLFERNSDVVAVYQAGFVGAWGEWHSSSNDLDSPENREAILNAVLAAVPLDRSVQLRNITYLIDAYPTALTEEYAYGSSKWARTGHHNDCVLVNSTDNGTYRPLERGEEFRTYLDTITPWVPVGGETCDGPAEDQRTDCPTAIAEFKRFHWSYLNRFYYEGAIERWQDEGCFDEISKHLGYRYRLIEATAPSRAIAGSTLSLALRITNDGWAGIFNRRKATLVLRNQSTDEEHHLPFDVDGVRVDDARRWLPLAGVTKTLNIGADLPVGMTLGTYDLYLDLPDAQSTLAGDARYSIRLANQLAGQTIWDKSTGYNALGIKVEVAELDQ